MYLSFSKFFLIPAYYAYKDTLEIKKLLKNRTEFRNYMFWYRQGIIGLSLPTEVQRRWARDGKAMEQRADMLGIPIIVKIADNNENKQVQQIEELIAEGVRILIIVPINANSLGAVIEKAKKLGIKIIAYDRLILNSDIDAYVTFNSERVGQLQGRYLIEKVPNGNYVIISGDPGDNNSKLLKEGAMEYIQPRVLQRYINIIKDESADKWSPEIAYNIVKDALKATNNKIDAILAPSDTVAEGVVKALEENGLAGKVQVTGQDSDLQAAQRVVKGTQGMTVFKDTRELGKEAVNVAIKLVRGEPLDANYSINNGKIDVPSVLLTPVLVDKNNLDKVLIDSGYLNKNDVYERKKFVK